MKKNFSTILLIVIFLIGLSLLLYPTFSDFWNSKTQSKVIASYMEQVSSIENEMYDELWAAAEAYNASLAERSNGYILTDEQKEEYNSLLNVSGGGIMGYIEIPCIDASMPIYHGTDENVLQVAVGHIDWTSLPVGGESTHTVISGHRGLPSARLFTDLDQLVVGDRFMLHVLDETLTYEVDQIRIVLPSETQELLIQEGEDLCTLVTCTPYGVNSHRLLVRGHRVENAKEEVTVRVTADAIIIDKTVVAPFVLAPILIILLITLLVYTGKKKR